MTERMVKILMKKLRQDPNFYNWYGFLTNLEHLKLAKCNPNLFSVSAKYTKNTLIPTLESEIASGNIRTYWVSLSKDFKPEETFKKLLTI